MRTRVLGRTGLDVSVLAFGAGPVSGLLTGTDDAAQLATVMAAIDAGVNWFDTAAGYGNGASETALGRVLNELGAADRFHVATKVRIPPETTNLDEFIRESVAASLRRLRVPRVTLLQIHNGITHERGDEPASITPRDILGDGGVLESLRSLQRDGQVQHIGLTGTGHAESLREVVRSGEFDTLQVPFNLLNPSAGRSTPPANGDTDYGSILTDCATMQMGTFAIRVFAGGALLGQAPSAHTLKTPYFPLALYQRDAERARLIEEQSHATTTMPELAVKFVLSHPALTSAIIGFGSPNHVRELAAIDWEREVLFDDIIT